MFSLDLLPLLISISFVYSVGVFVKVSVHVNHLPFGAVLYALCILTLHFMSYENRVQLLIKCVCGSVFFDCMNGLIKRVGDPLHCSEKKTKQKLLWLH